MEHISIDDFKKVDIKIGTILSAEFVPDADKLIRFEVDLGEESPRQILSGIRAHYPDPSVLIGKQVPVIANLAPRTIRGLESRGMILYVVGENAEGEVTTFTTLEPNGSVPSGTGAR